MRNKTIKLDKIIAGICVFGMIFTVSPIPSYALSAAEQSVQDYIVTDPNKMIYPGDCKTDLIKGNPDRGIQGFEAELKSFMEFLDANFKNKSSTSSLTSLAIARYREYRDALRKQFKHVQISGSRQAEVDARAQADSDMSIIPYYLSPFQDSVSSYALCEEMVNTYISLGRQEMIKHIKKSAVQKKTVMLLEKYKVLNTKLRALNMKIAELFALYTTFKNKFPGYATKNCMKS
ncbi:MAG: hypothetical protein WCX95_01890 [Candidatus Gracilibacteria bacterium]